jgi:monoamine oxidase
MERRRFLAAAACAPFVACARKSDPALPPGEFLGSDPARAHRLRDGGLPAPTETRRVPVLIVGAGIGGLSAAWQLDRSGLRDYQLLELEAQPGGNARAGQNAVSAYPLGAHYLPLPPTEAITVRELLADLGALAGDPQAARPHYDERLLCHAPQERLAIGGYWQDGLVPHFGLAAADRAQILRFQERMAAFKTARDPRGRRAFALPVAFSSPDPRWRALDRLTMKDWLLGEGFTSPYLHWYADYACRDDYGTGHDTVSAWAGIHYFACRNGAAENAAGDAVLTAPEGNGWIVRRLAERAAARLSIGATVFRVAQDAHRVAVDVWLAAESRSVRIEASALIWAAPLFVLARVLADPPPALSALVRADSHAPWLVAQLTLAEPPAAGAGAPLAWDNVIYGGRGLGYVVATHQQIRAAPAGPTVLTYYRPLTEFTPQAGRAKLLETPRETWAGEILADLSRVHIDLPRLTQRLDVIRHAHAMIRPLPGRLFAPARAALARGAGRIQFAHADLSGLSLFEEAHGQGVRAARAVAARLG